VDIVDLRAKYHSLYMRCLEDWWPPDKCHNDARPKRRWFRKMKRCGLRVKLAITDHNIVGGMIEYVPIERSPAAGAGLYFVNCLWVIGYDEAPAGNLQGKGLGHALLEAAERGARQLGAQGMAAWASHTTWCTSMKLTEWYAKHGYVVADSHVDPGAFGCPVHDLVWKRFTRKARPPRWIRAKRKLELVPGKVTVTVFNSGWCPSRNYYLEGAKRVARTFGRHVVLQEYDGSNRRIVNTWGITDGLFIDGKTYKDRRPERIAVAIARRVETLRKRRQESRA